MIHNAVIGSTTLRESQVKAGSGPHVTRIYPTVAGLAALAAGAVMARDAGGALHPYGSPRAIAMADGDGAGKSFTVTLGSIVPGTLSISDGVEAFTDDGFGTLTGDANGSGKVDYATGRCAVTFNAAPAEGVEVSASATYTPAGILLRDMDEGASEAEVVVFGPVRLPELTVSGAAPEAALLRELDNMGLWPIG